MKEFGLQYLGRTYLIGQYKNVVFACYILNIIQIQQEDLFYFLSSKQTCNSEHVYNYIKTGYLERSNLFPS